MATSAQPAAMAKGSQPWMPVKGIMNGPTANPADRTLA